MRVAILTLMLAAGTAVHAQDIPLLARPPKPWPQVMVVGTVHLANPGRDAVKSELDDVLAPKRQREIEALVGTLARFKPTKIAIEREPGRMDRVNESYRAYLAGTYALTRNEIDQVGFRLGKQLGLSQLHGVDHSIGLDFDAALKFAAQNGQQAEVAWFGATVQRMEAYFNQLYARETISGIIAAQNNDAQSDDGVALYQLMSRIGKDSVYIGADVATDWYKRNLRIYANVLRILEPNDRVLILIGGGHRPLLRQFFLQHPGIEFVSTLPYLK